MPGQELTTLERVAEIGTMLFPVWALISASIAFFHPPSLNWMTTTQFEQGVGLLMLAMGLSLSMEDFKKVKDWSNILRDLDVPLRC